MAASTGTVGDLYGNALAENVYGSYKNELVHSRSWDDGVEVEIATLKWVCWWNETRLHQNSGHLTRWPSWPCMNAESELIVEVFCYESCCMFT
ncbi:MULTISPECIES: integrase core domain-containing protein [Corynebacterium]|uniref:integrase core domain-containing protein n=1 Tax=Corynebacterium TaxID=1716 RepID=UPI0009ECF1D4